ncbi:MAG: hypothetical protein ACRDO8_08015 [Nocardioidaceae bacterium]
MKHAPVAVQLVGAAAFVAGMYLFAGLAVALIVGGVLVAVAGTLYESGAL